MKANKSSKSEMTLLIKEASGRNSIGEKWLSFIDNLYDNTDIGVYTVVMRLLLEHTPQKIRYSDAVSTGRYFSPVQGFNVGKNIFRDTSYSGQCFRGYFGFGTYRKNIDGGDLSTELAFKFLKNVRENNILRIDLQSDIPKIDLITYADVDKYKYNFRDLLYYCRYMQYHIIEAGKNTYVANNYEVMIKSLTNKLNLNVDNINLESVGAVEFIIPNYETKKDSEFAFKLSNYIYTSLIETD